MLGHFFENIKCEDIPWRLAPLQEPRKCGFCSQNTRRSDQQVTGLGLCLRLRAASYLPIVERAYIISSTLHLDPAYQEPMRLLKET